MKNREPRPMNFNGIRVATALILSLGLSGCEQGGTNNSSNSSDSAPKVIFVEQPQKTCTSTYVDNSGTYPVGGTGQNGGEVQNEYTNNGNRVVTEASPC